MPGNDAFTKLLLHMDSNFTDSSGVGTGVSASLATISAVQSKFGGGSGLFTGGGNYLNFADTVNYQFGSGDWTIDFWIYPTTISANHFVYSDYSTVNAGYSVYFTISLLGGGQLSIKKDGSHSLEVNVPDGSFAVNTWQHVGCIRSGNNLYVAVNGNMGTPTDATSFTIYNPGNTRLIGNLDTNGDGPFVGYIDEFRISKGIARWTANFTPPTHAYNSNASDGGVMTARRGFWGDA